MLGRIRLGKKGNGSKMGSFFFFSLCRGCYGHGWRQFIMMKYKGGI